MTESPITPEVVAEHGLSPEEYQRVLKALGREPNLVELGIFSVMWSEHCSYKSSRVHLKKLPTSAPWVIQGPGENAGVIDIGDGDAAIFKMESHNHPSYIEPYQGAATGVGGILRDVFTMKARQIARVAALAASAGRGHRGRVLPRERARTDLPAGAAGVDVVVHAGLASICVRAVRRPASTIAVSPRVIARVRAGAARAARRGVRLRLA